MSGLTVSPGADVLDALAADHVAAGSVGALIERLDILAAGGAGEITAARMSQLLAPAIVDNINNLSVSSAAAADTFGSWIEGVASLSADVVGLVIGVMGVKGVATTSQVWELGTGAAASEVTLIEQAHYGTEATEEFAAPVYYPLTIASGTRVACRARDDSTSARTHRFIAWFIG